MKRLVVLILCIFVLCNFAYADEGILDKVVNFIKTHPARAGVYYDFTDNNAHEYIAATIAENVFIPKLDISAASDFDEAVIGQVDYTIKEGTISPYAGLGAGTNRIEDTKELGEFIFEIHAGVKF